MSHIRALQSLLTFFSLSICPVAVGNVYINMSDALSEPNAAYHAPLELSGRQAVFVLSALEMPTSDLYKDMAL